MTGHDETTALAIWMRKRHSDIKNREADALACLYGEKDEIAHRQLMMERAELIAALDVETRELVEALPESIRDDVAATVRRFAEGARNALRIDSVFYMSALLYPDEHKEGDPDSMDILIRFLES